jgi:hypothetical protein
MANGSKFLSLEDDFISTNPSFASDLIPFVGSNQRHLKSTISIFLPAVKDNLIMSSMTP